MCVEMKAFSVYVLLIIRGTKGIFTRMSKVHFTIHIVMLEFKQLLIKAHLTLP